MADLRVFLLLLDGSLSRPNRGEPLFKARCPCAVWELAFDPQQRIADLSDLLDRARGDCKDSGYLSALIRNFSKMLGGPSYSKGGGLSGGLLDKIFV